MPADDFGTTNLADHIVVSDASFTLEALAGNDTIAGEIVSLESASIDAGADDDTITLTAWGEAQSGAVTLLGGTGADTITASLSQLEATIGGGEGDDVLDLADLFTAVVSGDDGEDAITVICGAAESIGIDGGSGADTITAAITGNWVSDDVYDEDLTADLTNAALAARGVVSIVGGAGNDILDLALSVAQAVIDAGAGDDTIRLDTGIGTPDPRSGTAQELTLLTGAGRDTIRLAYPSWGGDGWGAGRDSVAVVSDFTAGPGGDVLDLSEIVLWGDPPPEDGEDGPGTGAEDTGEGAGLSKHGGFGVEDGEPPPVVEDDEDAPTDDADDCDAISEPPQLAQLWFEQRGADTVLCGDFGFGAVVLITLSGVEATTLTDDNILGGALPAIGAPPDDSTGDDPGDSGGGSDDGGPVDVGDGGGEDTSPGDVDPLPDDTEDDSDSNGDGGGGGGDAGGGDASDPDAGEDGDSGTGAEDGAFWGDAEDNLFEGGDGDDTMAGGAGADNLAGGAGADLMSGGTEDDTLDGGDGDDFLAGGQGDDTLTGALGDDTINGGTGDDTIEGGAGDDVLGAGRGSDTVSGGAGEDAIGGGAGQDLISGDAGDDMIGGGAGDDTILGGAGDDFLAGGGRNDLISGDAGNDTLNGGAGNDTLTGGAGADLFVFTLGKAGNLDILTDFSRGEDLIQIAGLDKAPGTGLQGFFEALSPTTVNYEGETAVQLSFAGQTILCLGIDGLTKEDFLFL
ncbi:calcium-binding protein [Rhodobacter lacus]|uniref:Calcium-binding protein n=1 Tax=Rhodobacter lacus TaxID=1641972 RepID=A0ABW5A9R2_9RHOB